MLSNSKIKHRPIRMRWSAHLRVDRWLLPPHFFKMCWSFQNFLFANVLITNHNDFWFWIISRKNIKPFPKLKIQVGSKISFFLVQFYVRLRIAYPRWIFRFLFHGTSSGTPCLSDSLLRYIFSEVFSPIFKITVRVAYFGREDA